jgi:RNA polymerase sigma-70 factor (ECF subfamily)
LRDGTRDALGGSETCVVATNAIQSSQDSFPKLPTCQRRGIDTRSCCSGIFSMQAVRAEFRENARSIGVGSALERVEGRRMTDEDIPRKRSLEAFRSYLVLLTRMQLASGPRNRIDPSDIVQQTLLEAHAKADQFHGDDSALAAWLRQALVNNLRDAWRALRQGKRDIRREESVHEAVEQSSARLAGMLAAPHSSPSQRAMRNEDLLNLADALTQLPELQREAIVLHHLQGCSLSETARSLERTDAAVAGLLHRGLKKLRELMPSGE